MGHNRLGSLPNTKPWRRVIAHIAEGDSVETVAGAASQAAINGLKRGANDPGVTHLVFLLARAAVAARHLNFATALGGVGIFVPPNLGLFNFTSALTAAMRNWYENHLGTHTDLAEMAVLAGAETVTHIVGERVPGLFPTGQDFHNTVRTFATKMGFAHLIHEFFARFIRRFLLYHISRELSQHVGGNSRFADVNAHNAFLADLATHCHEAAWIVRTYSGEWYDKARFEKGITEQQTQAFTAYCLREKLANELIRRGQCNG